MTLSAALVALVALLHLAGLSAAVRRTWEAHRADHARHLGSIRRFEHARHALDRRNPPR